MKRKGTVATASETLEILKKSWLNNDDIMRIAGCGQNRALTIRKQIKNDLESQGIYCAYGLVPSAELVKFLKINVDYLKKMSKVNNIQKNGEVSGYEKS